MSFQELIKGDPLTWLLEAESPNVRYLALRDLLKRPETDPELQSACAAAHTNGPIAEILDQMENEGYWVNPNSGYHPKYRSTVWSVILLAQLGARLEKDERINRACNYVLTHTFINTGQFTTSGSPSGTADCLQGNLCWALLALGCTDPRLEKAFEWMARTVTGEGIAPMENRQAEVRYYAGKCGPVFRCGSNNKLPCAWGAAKVMLAFGKLSEANKTPLINRAIQQGVDFLFSIDPATANYPCGYSSKPSHNWWKFGFPVFYVTDLLQIVEALADLGYGDDPRLSDAIKFISEKQDASGRWLLEYDYSGKTWGEFGVLKQPNKWVTLRALRVLQTLKTVQST